MEEARYPAHYGQDARAHSEPRSKKPPPLLHRRAESDLSRHGSRSGRYFSPRPHSARTMVRRRRHAPDRYVSHHDAQRRPVRYSRTGRSPRSVLSDRKTWPVLSRHRPRAGRCCARPPERGTVRRRWWPGPSTLFEAAAFHRTIKALPHPAGERRCSMPQLRAGCLSASSGVPISVLHDAPTVRTLPLPSEYE
jgi:hypothetical protein